MHVLQYTIASGIFHPHKIKGSHLLQSPIESVVVSCGLNGSDIDKFSLPITLIHTNGVFTLMNVAVNGSVSTFDILDQLFMPPTFWIGGSVHVCVFENHMVTIPTIGVSSLFAISPDSKLSFMVRNIIND